MIRDFFVKHAFALKWIGLAFMIKLSLFVFFAFNFLQNWPAKWVTNFIFITTGDTPGYYAPLESFAHGNGYDSFCRMPGLLPFYAPLRFFLSEGASKAGIIIFQFLFSVLSVFFLAQVARHILKSQRAFYFVFFVYAFSSFVSIWDHYGMSESFGTSFLIFSIYFLIKFRNTRYSQYLLLSGLFIIWSVFFRAVHAIFIPVIVLFFVLDFRQLVLSFKNCIVFCLPVFLFLGLWTYKNYSQYNKAVVLTGSVFDCTGFLSQEHIAIRELIIAWGGDYQPWSKGSEAEWFFQDISSKNSEPSPNNIYTSKYNLDSLLQLRDLYERCHKDTITREEKSLLVETILTKSKLYVTSYKVEHPYHYYFLNKLRILRLLLIPNRLDDLPLPAMAKMNLPQKMIKGGYFLLFILVNIIGLIGLGISLLKKDKWTLFPLSLLTVIGIVFGYVEQRYLVPVYPFFVIYSVYAFLLVSKKSKTETI